MPMLLDDTLTPDELADTVTEQRELAIAAKRYPYVTDNLGNKSTDYRPGRSYAVWAPNVRVLGVFDIRWDGYVEATRYGTLGDSYYTHNTPDAAVLWIAGTLNKQ